MKELKKLCIRDNNPRLIYDLAEALMSQKVDLLCNLLKDVENAMEVAIPGLLPKEVLPMELSEKSSRGQIAKYIGRGSGDIGLYWSLGGEYTDVYLGVSIEDGVYVGIYCPKDEYHHRFKEMFKNERGYSSKKWSWYKWVGRSIPQDLGRDMLRSHEWRNIEFLCDDKRRQEFATAIAQELKEIWDTVRKNTSA